MLLALLHEVEREDPIDFAGLPFDADDLRRLACLNVCEMLEALDASPEQRDAVTAATIARLVLENMVLHARIALLSGDAG